MHSRGTGRPLSIVADEQSGDSLNELQTSGSRHRESPHSSPPVFRSPPRTNPFDDVSDNGESIPRIPAHEPRRPRLDIPGSSGRPGTSRRGSRIATPSNERYFSPYATPTITPGITPVVSRRTSFAFGSRLSLNSDASTHDLSWTARQDGPYAYAHDANSSTHLNTQTITEKFDIGSTTSLLWDPSYVEDDDDLHNPELDNPRRDVNIWTRRGALNLGGLAFIVVALIIIFVVIPAITFWRASNEACTGDTCLFAGPRALLSIPRTDLVDPDTPSSALTKQDVNGNTLTLTFSDEFNKDGRTFYPGDDQFFEAKDLWYWPTQDLEWYDPDAVTTRDGYLELRMDAYQNHDMNYRSGMIHSWNMLCFKGGMIEVSVSLPGSGAVSGLWPAIWTMGNLGRPGYGATTDGMWPYSYQECDVGITPNQSRIDGLSWLPGMRLPVCVCEGSDTAGTVVRGRSAPEIDIFEASIGSLTDGTNNGIVSQSYQIAPFDDFYQPNYEFAAISNSLLTSMNQYTGGPYQQALSGVTTLNNKWYQYPTTTAGEFQTYGFHYTPGNSTSSAIQWYVAGQEVWNIQAAILGPNGNIGPRTITEEPMTIVMNLALSQSFAYIDWEGLEFPNIMKIDYVRIYQDETGSMTCDPPGWETTEYIANHPNAYTNKNFTKWSDAGYEKPLNSFMNTC